MLSRFLRELSRRQGEYRSDRLRGLPVSPLRFSSYQSVALQVGHASRLPTDGKEDGVAVQDGSGNLLFDSYYSDPAGPDIV